MSTDPSDEIDLGVIVALPAEADGWAGLRPDAFAVEVAGPGRERARRAAERAVERGARALLSWGVAGGLSPQLRSGDLLLPRRIVSGSGEWPTHDGWRARLLRALTDVHEIDILHCGDAPVISPGEKQALALRGFGAVDMESAGVAEAAARAGVPFVAVKAVCDPAARAVPRLALRMLGPEGLLRWRSIVEAALAGPGTWRELNSLRQDFGAACAGLRRAAQELPRAAGDGAP